MSSAWSPGWRAASPLFAPLQPLPASLCSTSDWPDCAELNRHAAARGLVNTLGLPICFIPDGTASPEQSYEARIYHTGQVATRTHNWHDYSTRWPGSVGRAAKPRSMPCTCAQGSARSATAHAMR